MTRTQTAIVLPMAGLPMPVILQQVLATTYLTHQLGLLERATSIEMFLVKQSPISCPILLINFGYLPRQTSGLNTSSLTGQYAAQKACGVGDHIRESISTAIISIYLSLAKAIKMVRSFKSHY